MNRFSAKLGVTALAAILSMGGISSTLALPMSAAAPAATTGGDVVNVQMRHHRRDRRGNRHHRRGGFEQRGSSYYYHGHRGYRSRRPGYRQYNGYWFPPAAFVAGAIIGGAISGGAAPRGNAHVQWCANNYRSYRASDDTFQPYNGPRQRCASPYD